MLERCRQHADTFNFGQCIKLQLGDLTKIELEPCNLAVINFTLQFIDVNKRQSVINSIYEALHENGSLIISEKNSRPKQ